MSQEEVWRFLEYRKNDSKLKEITDNRLSELEYITSIANQSGFNFTVEEYKDVLLNVGLYLHNKEKEDWIKWILLIGGIAGILSGFISGDFMYFIAGGVFLWMFYQHLQDEY